VHEDDDDEDEDKDDDEEEKKRAQEQAVREAALESERVHAEQQQAAEFAVLRTMGLSTRQILVVVGVEKLLVIVVSVLLGALVGLQLGVLMLDFVGFVETGEELLPPFVRVTDWATLGGALAVLLLAFAATIGIIVVLYMRLAIGQALRIGAD